jgi:hypothetical protein
MRARLLPALAGTLAVMLLGTLAVAQNQPAAPSPPTGQTAVPLTSEQLDQLTAPIALYPDALVGEVLMASTYPLEIVEADRWLQQSTNASLTGDPLAAALEQQPWDPSVKSLVAFPQVLKMMDGNLTWTERLGDAFLAGQAVVMDSIQRLRHKAEAAGKLKSTPQEVVSNSDGTIVIAPPDSNSVYVPVYDPSIVYGEWFYPDYPPDYFPGYFPGVTIGPGGFGWLEIGVVASLWGWDSSDWRGHRFDIDANRFNALNNHQPPVASEAWQHNPAHRGGVPYRDPAARARFQGAATPSRDARGFPAGAPEAERPPAAAERPAPQNERAPAVEARPPVVIRPTPPVLQSFGRGPDVRAQAQRGQASRASAPAPRAAAPRAAPAARSAPAGGGRHK